MPKIFIIIPALNEEKSIGKVLADIPKTIYYEALVIDNGSTDLTAAIAKKHGATVLHEPMRGYGAACLKGMSYVAKNAIDTDIVVFMDADYSDFPEEMQLLITPIQNQKADIVIGSRVALAEKGALMPVQRFGNWLSTKMIYYIFNKTYTDLGPFRAITWQALKSLNMQDLTYGWTVEMQVKCAKMKIPSTEINVNYRPRIGVSKISGTVIGSIKAGYKIIFTILKYWWQ